MRALSFSVLLVLVVSLQIAAGADSSAFTKLMSDIINDEYADVDEGKFSFELELTRWETIIQIQNQ